MRILVADDDPLLTSLLETKLRKWGYEPVVACDGNEAWEVLQRQDAPRLAILDWAMPGLSGPEICRKARRQKGEHYTYLILMTGRNRTEDIVEGMESGADDYATKPVNSAELKARLHAARRILDLHEQLLREGRAREEQQRHHLEDLSHSRRLEAVGQLAAGIAHEINTPMQYTGDNTRFIQESFNEIAAVLAACRRLMKAGAAGELSAEQIAEVQAAFDEADIEYLLNETPQAIKQSLEGIKRVTEIVRAMKNFSPPGVEDKAAVDINECVESTITISRNEWKYVAEMQMDLDASLPPVVCLPGEVNQVVLNLIVNAAHAIADVVGDASEHKGVIRVSTRRDGDWVELRVGDTGGGIPEEIRPRIFEPFFTTKDVGKGTGQGLTIARSAVVDKHGGTITFDSEAGKGTTFIVRLPLGDTSRKQQKPLVEAAAV
ncbi:MAG: ATP-binding protein [Phycisphaerae bacterium]